MKYLSETGLAHFWSKIKSYVSSNYKKLNGSSYYVRLTGGNGNTSGYRLVLAKDVDSGGLWNNSSLSLQITSRHTGTGTLNIDFRISGSLASFKEDTRYYGSMLESYFGWKQYYNSETGMYYLFWKFSDHDICSIVVAQQRNFSDALPTNGEWIEGEIDESIYGKEYPINFNVADTATTAIQDSDGRQINTNYLRKSLDYLNTHPENSGTIIPFINNDIAFLIKKGGSAKVYYDDVEKTVNIDNVFDASPNYWRIEPSKIPVTTLTIELTLHTTFTWQSTIYFDNGASGWRAKNVKIEVMNSGYADDVWTTKYENTNLTAGNARVTFNHQPVGATSQGPGFNKIRFTFTNWNNAADFRIAQLGVIGYSSYGTRITTMSRGIDDSIFRSITPYYTNTYNLGSSTNKWREVHATSFKGNADTATNPKSNQLTNTDLNTLKTTGFYHAGENNSCTNKPTGVYAFGLICYQSAGGYFVQELESSNNKPMTKYIRQWNASTWSDWTQMKYTDTTYSAATTSASGLMSASDKSKLDGFKQATEYYDTTTTDLKIQKAVDNLNIVNITYKDTVATFEDLPETAETGDLYSISTGGDYIWNGTDWVEKNTLLTKSIKLTDNTDLNNVINEGEYYGNSSCLNKPNDSGAFYLKVINQIPNVIQELRDTVNGRQYYRIIAFDGSNAYYGNWIETYLGIKGVYYDNLLGGEYRSTINLGKGLEFGVSDELTVNTSDLDEATQSAKGLMSASDKTVFDKMPIIKSGSKIISATNSNGAQLFTKAELQTLFGVTSNFSINRVSGCVVNGDTAAFSGNYLGLRIASSNSNIYVYLDQTVSGTVNMKCNYTLFYNRE